MTSNVAHYSNVISATRELNKNNRARRETYYLFQPIDRYFVDPITEFVANRLAMPGIKILYNYTGKLAIRLAIRIGEERAKKVEEGWYDPVSTKFLLKLSWRISRITRFLGNRTPTWIPIITYPDTCVVVASRHVYILATDIHAVLSLPQELRNHADRICAIAEETVILPAEEEVIPPPPVEKLPEQSYWNLFKSACYQGYEVSKNYLSSAVSTMATRATNITKEAIRKKAHAIIEEKEKKAKVTLVGKIVNTTCRQGIEITTRWLVRGGFGVFFYQLTKHAIEAIIPEKDEEAIELAHRFAQIASFGITAGGAILWIRCLTPSVQRLYQSRDIEFNPEASTIKELKELLGKKNKIWLIKDTYDILSAGNSDAARLTKFLDRVEKLPQEDR